MNKQKTKTYGKEENRSEKNSPTHEKQLQTRHRVTRIAEKSPERWPETRADASPKSPYKFPASHFWNSLEPVGISETSLFPLLVCRRINYSIVFQTIIIKQ